MQSFDYIIAEWSYEDCMTFECLVRLDEATQANFDAVWEEIDKEIGVGFNHIDPTACTKDLIRHDPELYRNTYAKNFPLKAFKLKKKMAKSIQLTLAYEYF